MMTPHLWLARDRSRVVAAAVLLLALSLLFWNFRIFENGVNPTMEVGPVDLYIAHIPVTEYGYQELQRGHLPLWNPYQLCGQPFFALPYSALFYPLHAYFLAVDPLASFEISFVLHMFIGGFGMWCLARHFGCDALGATCAAVTFMWSGYLILTNILPMIFASLNLLPVTVLLVDNALLGARWARIWLVVALASQILLGATEVVLHTGYAAGIFVVGRLGHLVHQDGWRVAAMRLAAVAACGVVSVLLAAPQLLPTLELAGQSSRSPGSLSFEQASWAAVPAPAFLRQSLEGRGFVSVGILPLLGIGLAVGAGRWRFVSICALVGAVAAALLITGGAFYRLYFSIPVLGGLFRAPMKFADIYAFFVSLLAGLAVTRMNSWARLPLRPLWLRPSWLFTILSIIAVLVGLESLGVKNFYCVAIAIALVAFGIVSRPTIRVGIVVGICLVHGASLFFTRGDQHIRPAKRPEIFTEHQHILDLVRRDLGNSRVYLSPRFLFTPGLTPKQGVLNQLQVSTDYEPLAVGRYRSFFDRVSKPHQTHTPFFGVYSLDAETRWGLMNLTGTRYFVLAYGEAGEVFMRQHPADFRPVHAEGFIRVYEQLRVLPRAYVVSQWRSLPTPELVLAALDSADFDPTTEALFEEPEPGVPSGHSNGRGEGHVDIHSYEPERVVVDASTTEPGFLILTDVLYPGWKAFVNDREVPIHRVNYLFRAVHIDAGRSRIRFEYHPGSLRWGLLISVATALGFGPMAGARLWRRHSPSEVPEVEPSAPPPQEVRRAAK